MNTRWYCIRTKHQQEDLAADSLRRLGDVEVINPRLRISRATADGVLWLTEALFPSYLFARLDLTHHFGLVRVAPGAVSVAGFGRQWAVVPDEELGRLRQCLDGREQIDSSSLDGGEIAEIVRAGGSSLIAAACDARDGTGRVRALLDYLDGILRVEFAGAVTE